MSARKLPQENNRPAADEKPAGGISVFRREDIPEVAGLFQRVFRNGADRAPSSLERYFEEVFFEHPWRSDDIPSPLWRGPTGRIDAFLGVVPGRLALAERRLRTAICCMLMVHPDNAPPLAAAQLLRSVLKGPQDLSYADTANFLAQKMWTDLGGLTLPVQSLTWLRILQPARLVMHEIGKRTPAPAFLTNAIGRWGDVFLWRMVKGHLALEMPQGDATEAVEADEGALLACINTVLQSYPVRPDLDQQGGEWLLRQARRRSQEGALVARIVSRRGGQPIGCYLYYRKPGGIADVLDIFAAPRAAEAVLENLLVHARSEDHVAVRGGAHRHLMVALHRQRCIFHNRGATVVHSRDKALQRSAAFDDGFLGAFAGERWALFGTEQFT